MMPPASAIFPRCARACVAYSLPSDSARKGRPAGSFPGLHPCRAARSQTNQNNHTMHLTPKEIDKLMLLSLGLIAERRMKKGLKLNYPEAVAYITSTALEGAREGKTVEEVMKGAASVLTKDDVMEGVADMIDLLQVEAVFTDGSRLVSIHHPIK